MNRQRILERAGWVFWREFASIFIRRRTMVIEGLLNTLKARGIEPLTGDRNVKSVHSEFRRVRAGEWLSSDLADAVAFPEDHPSTISTKAAEVMPVSADTTDMQDVQMTFSGKALSNQMKFPLSIDLPDSKSSSEKQRTQSNTGTSGTAYSDEALRAFLREHGLTTEDNRGKNGAIWVHLDDERSQTAQQLSAWGFRYKGGRGWWKK
jgi:hypothetical protein